MTLDILQDHMYTLYTGEDAQRDGATVRYTDYDDVPYYQAYESDDYVVSTDDAGAVLCRSDGSGLLCEICTPTHLIGAEGFPNDFVLWLRADGPLPVR